MTKPPKIFQNGFSAMLGGLKYQERIKTQLLRRTAPTKFHKRKYKPFIESWGQNDPPPLVLLGLSEVYTRVLLKSDWRSRHVAKMVAKVV